MPARAFPLIVLMAPLVAPVEAQPLAYVFDHEDKWTHSAHAADLLRAAGFRVEPLPLDRPPAELEAGVIVLGSFVSEDPRYATYMARHARGLLDYVDKGHVLVQLTQADQTEPEPPFLPGTQGARRADPDFAQARVLAPGHPLMTGVEAPDGILSFHATRTIWESFVEQGGFEVILAADETARNPALMEAACGQGRIILSAIAFDKTIDPPAGRTPEGDAALEAFRRSFFANLSTHAVEVRAHRAPPPRVTPSTLSTPGFVPGSWTLVVLPDTQNYSQHYPGLFHAQTGWIAANRERRDVRYVIQLGDIVNNNAPGEWRHARDALGLLDGLVPVALVPGNHDYGPGGDASTRDTLLNEFFPFETYGAMPTFGGAMEPGRLDNTWHLFEAGGRRWIIVCLEWGPRDQTIRWAGEVMERHPGRTGILVTHAYMNNNDRRYDHTDPEHPQDYNPHQYRTPGGVNDGEELWQKLVRRHDFALALNGHVLGDGTGYLASTNDRGRTVHQILANYQMRELGGEGYLRLMEFLPDGRTVRVKSYSPVFNRYMTEPDQQFEFVLDPPAGGPAEPR